MNECHHSNNDGFYLNHLSLNNKLFIFLSCLLLVLDYVELLLYKCLCVNCLYRNSNILELDMNITRMLMLQTELPVLLYENNAQPFNHSDLRIWPHCGVESLVPALCNSELVSRQSSRFDLLLISVTTCERKKKLVNERLFIATVT